MKLPFPEPRVLNLRFVINELHDRYYALSDQRNKSSKDDPSRGPIDSEMRSVAERIAALQQDRGRTRAAAISCRITAHREGIDMNVRRVISGLVAVGAALVAMQAQAEPEYPASATASASSPAGSYQLADEFAAQTERSAAIFGVGAMFDEGIGVPRNEVQAFQWYARAAEQGHAEAMNRLGILYATGRGVTRDYVAAFAWYVRAAEKGSVRAASNIATAYFHGLGVAQSYAEAAKWLQPAAAQGDAGAQNKLGVMYNDGLGVTRDHRKALELLRLSAAQGYSPAMVSLGAMHANGTGVQQDDVSAYALIGAALEIGLPASVRDAALYQLGALEERLQEKQRPSAHRLARQMSAAAKQRAQ